MDRTTFARRIASIGLALALCAILAGCAPSATEPPEALSSSTPAATATSQAPNASAVALGAPMELTVFEYNVEYGGDESTDDVIRKIDADIVGVLESYNRLPQIARETGYPYYNVGLQILSKYPIHEPSGADGLYSLIEVQPGYVVAFFNTHLDYVKYGPKLLVDGMPVDDVLASEHEVRTDSMQILTPDMEALSAAGYPVFLTGDFNTPSHEDYGDDTLGSRKAVTVPVEWPTTALLSDIGMRDAYRATHPDPAAVPGLTKDNPEFRKGGFGDRIDYVWSGGPVETLDAQLVGEKGGPDVDRGFEPWTSDHRGVLATFAVTPVALPTTVSLDRRLLTEGERLTVFANAPGNDGVTLSIVEEGGAVADAITSQEISVPSEATFATTDAMNDLAPGGYEIIMASADGVELARNEFWVRSEQNDVIVTTDKASYTSGEPIRVSWDDGPANRWDWIGVYRKDASDPHADDYLLWGYTGGHESGALPPQVFGEMTFDASSQGSPWPLPPGRYRIHYLLTDKYASAGFTDITVT